MDYRISESVLNELLAVIAKLPYENVHHVFSRVREDVRALPKEEIERMIEKDYAAQMVAAQE